MNQSQVSVSKQWSDIGRAGVPVGFTFCQGTKYLVTPIGTSKVRVGFKSVVATQATAGVHFELHSSGSGSGSGY